MYSIGRIKYWYRVQTATVIKPIHLFPKIKKIVRTVMTSPGHIPTGLLQPCNCMGACKFLNIIICAAKVHRLAAKEE